MRTLLNIAAAALVALVPAAMLAQDADLPMDSGPSIATLRANPLFENGEPPAMRAQLNADLRQVRAYPEQPPVVPHAIESYQVTANFNKCLECHARPHTGRSQAPMVSVTHYMDREGQVLGTISPRRYFCTQCHVPQHPDEPAVENRFVDFDTLVRQIARPDGSP